ncbi:hypothetical protein MUS1_08335 [Marinomonas ushuaiensis DSM 15871]|uniref:tRNA-uridine aminocarboxypropyltransferase n=2 Tax=Marinomonas TaxID=28253 RepID=X7E2W8_9GAMM|nr:hypothetical protein MUS1_08335 [Marinomonas ushuaiensis DSM 15871]
MKIWLLTHTEELKKTSGTGKLVKDTLKNDCEIIEWSRVSPEQAILDLPPTNTLLIYPYEEAQKTLSTTPVSNIDNIIIIDGTWQQARKIYNRSPYLKKFQHYEIKGVTSVYCKRRNQKNTGLCTAEVAIHILTEYQHSAAGKLSKQFLEFNQ